MVWLSGNDSDNVGLVDWFHTLVQAKVFGK